MFNTIFGAGAASRYGSGSDQKMQLLAAPAPQHCSKDVEKMRLFPQIKFVPVFLTEVYTSFIITSKYQPSTLPHPILPVCLKTATGRVFPNATKKDKVSMRFIYLLTRTLNFQSILILRIFLVKD
jgi:hypothetical protein